jgi:DNA mismatch repair protein MutS2
VSRWLEGVCPTLAERDDARDGLVRLHGVCHPLLLEPLLSQLPPLPRPDEPDFAVDDTMAVSSPSSSLNSWQSTSSEKPLRPRPIDLRVPANVRVVALTGPNTGGKTATLKTLGVSVLMAQAGMYIHQERDGDELPDCDLENPRVRSLLAYPFSGHGFDVNTWATRLEV